MNALARSAIPTGSFCIDPFGIPSCGPDEVKRWIIKQKRYRCQ